MKPVGIMKTTFSLLLLLGIAAPAYARQGNSDHQDKDKQAQSDKHGNNGNNKDNGKSEHGPVKPQESKTVPEARSEQRQARPQDQSKQVQEPQPQQVQSQNQRQQNVRAQQQQQSRQQEHDQQQVRVRQPQDRPAGWDKGKKVGWNGSNVPPGQQGRLPQERQQQLIVIQQQRVVQYREHLDSQQRLAGQYSAQMQQQNRMAEYRSQQQYLARVRQQQIDLQRAHNYNNDPFYYTAPIYRYNRGGSYYEINQYGANSLRQAVNYGYEQGYSDGQAARQDRWSNGYENSYAYQDANYGFDGYYIDQADYNYYFRQGFSRGYDDGYNSRYQYGQYAAGKHTILGALLGQILDFQSLR